jgi:hypothetical protein
VVGPDAVGLAAVLTLDVTGEVAGSSEPDAEEVAAETTASVEMGGWVARGEGGEDGGGRGEGEGVVLGCCSVTVTEAAGDVATAVAVDGGGVVAAAAVAAAAVAAAAVAAPASLASLLVSLT